MSQWGPDELFLGLFQLWMDRGEFPVLSLRPEGKGYVVVADRGQGLGREIGRDDESLVVAFLAAVTEQGRRRVDPPKVAPSVAKRFLDQILGWLDHHPAGEVNVSRVGDDKLVSFRSGTDAGTFFGQDGSLVRAVAEAAEVARLREHLN